jgi:hypothetical protein
MRHPERPETEDEKQGVGAGPALPAELTLP